MELACGKVCTADFHHQEDKSDYKTTDNVTKEDIIIPFIIVSNYLYLPCLN